MDQHEGQIEEDYPSIEVPENRVLLAFRNDSEGIAFREWWMLKGNEAFSRWLRKRRQRRLRNEVDDE